MSTLVTLRSNDLDQLLRKIWKMEIWTYIRMEKGKKSKHRLLWDPNMVNADKKWSVTHRHTRDKGVFEFFCTQTRAMKCSTDNFVKTSYNECQNIIKTENTLQKSRIDPEFFSWLSSSLPLNRDDSAQNAKGSCFGCSNSVGFFLLTSPVKVPSAY